MMQDDRQDVKREVVSASANLEVISHESFVKRLEGMSSSCADCQKERNRNQRKTGRKGKAGRRKQIAKANMPIVIHLKDTLKSSNKLRQSSLDMDSDVSSRSTDEEQCVSSGNSHSGGDGGGGGGRRGSQCLDYSKPLSHYPASIYGDVASIPEFVPQYPAHHFHQAWPCKSLQSGSSQLSRHKSPYYGFQSTIQNDNEKSRKNLTAFISVIEKAHMKEPAKDIEPNLSVNTTDAKLSTLLNNVSTSPLKDTDTKRKNMADCDNVELICNDLSTNSEKLVESTDESDASDKASVFSNSDALSDDASDLAALEEPKVREFSPEELEQLAEFTTGVPLIRYDCHPSQCPECTHFMYSHPRFQYTGASSYKTPLHSHDIHHDQANHIHRHPLYPHHSKVFPNSKIVHPHMGSTFKLSLSTDSDVSSDLEESSTSSTSSSTHGPITATVSAKACLNSKRRKSNRNSSTAGHGPGHPKTSQPHGQRSGPSHHGRRSYKSWTGERQLWDIDVSHASKKGHRHDSIYGDCVYMDLTGLDITYSVIYPSDPEFSWSAFTQLTTHDLPLPSPSAYPPLPSQGLNFPIKIPRQAFPTSQIHTPFEFHKHDMPSPPNRPWITSGHADKDVPAAVFSVMCYNVLCDKLCTKAMYGYCPTWALQWDYRKKGIMNDIIRCNADIITLQEVETEQYYSMFLPELAQQGYDGIFLPKSRVRTMNSEKEKKSVDGCAIFFKKIKFEKVNEYQIEFSQLATKDGATNTDTDMINRVSTKDNIAIVAVLRTKPGAYDNSPVPPPKGLSQMLMVSTAHIHWDPQSPDVKLVQTIMLIEELRKFVKEASMQFRPNAPPPSVDASDICNSLPLILCGDFNSLPDSGVYEFLSKGKLDTSHKDFEGQSYKAFMKGRNNNGTISHNFNLTSAYKDVIPFTNYTFDFKGIIDYIFYSHQHLRLHGVMGLQDEEWFKANKIIGCPHPYVPSDHFPLFAEFSLPAPPPVQRPR